MMGFILICLLIGLGGGMLSGLIGIGGGVIIVPALIYVLGFTQHQAQGTTLALMVPPIGLLAAWAYYRSGFVDIKAAAFICVGFVVGSYIGAIAGTGLPDTMLRRVFAVLMMLIAVKMFIGR